MENREGRRTFLVKAGALLLGVASAGLTGFRRVLEKPTIELAGRDTPETFLAACKPYPKGACGPCNPTPGGGCTPCSPTPGKCAPCSPTPGKCSPCGPTPGKCGPCAPTPGCTPCAPTPACGPCAPGSSACNPCAPHCSPTCTPQCAPYCSPKGPPGGSSSMLKANHNLHEVQARLRARGYYKGPLDGVWGPKTWSSIIEFKRANGLKPDGVVCADTWKLLNQ